MADYLREHHTSLRCIQIPDEDIRELSLLLEDRDRLIQQKVRFSNQLTSTLKEYFPQALDAFGSIDNKCTIKFLKRIDTYAELKALSAKKLEQLLKECGAFSRILRRLIARVEEAAYLSINPVFPCIHQLSRIP